MKAQSGNPEVRVRGTDPVINQIVDKLKHVIQVSAGLILMDIFNCKVSMVTFNLFDNCTNCI